MSGRATVYFQPPKEGILSVLEVCSHAQLR